MAKETKNSIEKQNCMCYNLIISKATRVVMKKFLISFLLCIAMFALVSCTGLDGNGIKSIEKTSTNGLVDIYTITYTDGETATFTVTNGQNGIDGINGTKGEDGHTPVITIQNGNWYIDGVNTEVKAEGVKGNTGNGISSIEKIGTEGLVDTYTITFTNGTFTTFTITNGVDGSTPQLQINSDTHEWEVSYDGGKSWINLGYQANIEKNNTFEGLKISILGDSISTYVNASNGAAATITNSTIKNNAVYYTEGKQGIYQGDTWWQQIADALGGSVLVNNSWSGSCVFSTRAGTVGAYVDRCVQLHDNTGLNAGEEPDLIFVYLGTNDATTWSSIPLGNYSDINFDVLIQKNEEGYIYAEPKTASEAYAIMIHKMINRYKDAEVYCMIPCQRIDGNEAAVQNRLQFYEAISKIANRFGAFIVDLYNKSGITTESEVFKTYISDNSLHPGCEGMDAFTNTILSSLYINSKYSPSDKNVYSVSYETDAIILEGRKYATLENESFTCSIKEKSGYELNVSVYMNGEDITEASFEGNKILIEKVTGNIEIRAEYTLVTREAKNFRFETIDDELVSVTTDGNNKNTITKIKGEISDGFYNSGHFSVETTIELLHNRRWAVEWKVKGDPSMLLLSGQSTSSGNINGDCYLFMHNTKPIISLGEYIGPHFTNYACLYDQSLQNDYHVYRIENIIDEQGNNMAHLFIDGDLKGQLNNLYHDATDKYQTSAWVNGKDFFFSYIGTTGTDYRHPISNCYLEYIQIWENLG